MKFIILLFAISFIIVSCSDIEYQCGPNDITPTTTYYAEVYDKIFQPKCIGCHSGDFASAGFDMNGDAGYTNMVNVNSTQRPNELFVVPGDAQSSYLFRKLTGEDIEQTRMPQGLPLEQAEIELVRKWINDGALKE